MNLAQKKIIVIGASSGIGLAIARASLDRGAHPVLVGRSADRLASAAAGLAGASTFEADATREEDIARLFAAHPSADHVVLTAVTPCYGPIRELEMAAVRRAVDSKLFAALHVARQARLNPGGSLLFTSGIATDRPMPGGSVIAAANGALEALVRALAGELAPLRVNALSPGWVDTPVWSAVAGANKPAMFAEQARRLPVRRIGTPDDAAHAALFLLENGYTTGETLHVDGGHRLV